MDRFSSRSCPVCGGKVQVSRLSCPKCGAEYPVSEPLSPYSQLSDAQAQFLSTFLKCRGSLKAVGEQMGLSYPTVKKRFDDLLSALGYLTDEKEMETIDMGILEQMDHSSNEASDIIKRKIYENGGAVTIPLLDGKPCKLFACNDGESFVSDKLNDCKLKFQYKVFDHIVALLMDAKDGKALKGNGHGQGDKVGYGRCTADTVVGTVAINYFGKSIGESTYDPVFVLAAALDWAGIAVNGRGYIELSSNYRASLDETEIISALSKRFENELKQNAAQAKIECGYNPTVFLSMISQYGGVETAKRLIRSYLSSGRISDGYERLWKLNRLDLAMEASVIKPEYRILFDDEEISTCEVLIHGTAPEL